LFLGRYLAPTFNGKLITQQQLVQEMHFYIGSVLIKFICRWWAKETVAVVTGANRGIGLEIARQLAKLGLTVILTARDDAQGREAVEKLSSQGLDVAFHPLDIAYKKSIDDFVEWLQTKYGGLEILVSYNLPLVFDLISFCSINKICTVAWMEN
jgi:hypothetical protein